MNLEIATISYGSSRYDVESNALIPLPTVFDFDNAEECARTVFAMMSNACGGFTLKDCTLRIHRGRKSANLTSHGTHVYYADSSQPKLPLEELIQMNLETEVFKLGNVSSDQYGGGWKRAQWKAAN